MSRSRKALALWATMQIIVSIHGYAVADPISDQITRSVDAVVRDALNPPTVEPEPVKAPQTPPETPPDVTGSTQIEDQPVQRSSARASWYGEDAGTQTASGQRFNQNALTFAHRTMAFGTVVEFCNGGRCIQAKCTDRGPAAWTGRQFDLSRAAFAAIAPLSRGVTIVSWSVAK